MAKPIVAINIPSNAELIFSCKTGLLVPPADSYALAEGMLTLLNNQEFGSKIGEEARIDVKRKYNILQVKERTENLYDSLLGKKLKRRFSSNS